jgi:3-ketosteroid 9alpha-monooxygenase subunit B
MSRPAYHQVTVVEVVEETADACSLVIAEAFDYKPGQFLTLRVPHETLGSVARCYSLSSAPATDDRLKVTVKRVKDGHVSNWICDNVRVGSSVEVLPPAGSFTADSAGDDLLFLAGGSGITPVISLIKAALAEGSGHIALVYANRHADSVIFGQELAELVRSHPRRLRLAHWLDADQGYPTAAGLTALVEEYAGRDAFICGPEPYMALAAKVLAGVGTLAEKVHIERFTVDVEPATDDDERVASVSVEYNGHWHSFAWSARKRMLDVFIDGGLNAPYSCRQGNCGACMLRLVEGEVSLVHNEILEEEDFADGYTLACQALPVTDSVRVSYDAP